MNVNSLSHKEEKFQSWHMNILTALFMKTLQIDVVFM